MIYGHRIRQVRELFGWTQTNVAEQVGVKQPFIAHIESGRAPVPDEFMRTFVFRTGFPPQFFEIPPDTELPLGSLLFRARADMREREQKALRTHASMAYEVLQRMLAGRSVQEIAVTVPNVAGDPEHAAALTRSELGLSPDQPIKHVIHVMESAGVLVIGLPRPFVSGDAFCVWALGSNGGRRPIVVLSADRPADRVRLSAAHELGHLVMHQPLPASRDVHVEADRFAGAFLLPPDAMREEVTKPTTLETFLSIKLKWGVSVQAAIVRAFHLELITQRKYRTLFQRLSARGWRTHEPMSSRVPLERPRGFRQIAELVFGRRLDYGRIAKEIHYPEAFLRELLEAHAGRDRAASALPSTPDSNSKGPEDVLAFPSRKF